MHYFSVFTALTVKHHYQYHFCIYGDEACVRGKWTVKSQGMCGAKQQVASCVGTGHGEHVSAARNEYCWEIFREMRRNIKLDRGEVTPPKYFQI